MARTLVLLLVFNIAAGAVNLGVVQTPGEDKIYSATEVDVPAKFKNELDVLPTRKGDCPSSVRVALKIVLRKSGKVTDVTILMSSGCSYDQEAIKAVSKLKFEPALKDGQPVSQYSQLEYAYAPSSWPSSTTRTKPVGDQSLSYGLLLDQSGSKENAGHIASAARAIINSNAALDQTFIVRFVGPDKIDNVQAFSTDKTRLLKTLDELGTGGGRAAIIDAVYVSAQYLLAEAGGLKARPALVLITHGDEQSSLYKLDQLVSALREHKVRFMSSPM